MEAVLTSSQEKEVNNNQTVKEGAETLTTSTTSTTSRTVSVTDPEEWICVAKLPPDTDQQAFEHLLADFGAVKDSFLQKTTKTGESYSQFCELNKAIFNSQFLPLSLFPSRSILCLRAEHRGSTGGAQHTCW